MVHLAELWRYPIKSLQGEQLQGTTLTSLGVPGDRARYVVGRRGIIDARSRPKLLALDPRDPDVERKITEAVGAEVALVEARSTPGPRRRVASQWAIRSR